MCYLCYGISSFRSRFRIIWRLYAGYVCFCHLHQRTNETFATSLPILSSVKIIYFIYLFATTDECQHRKLFVFNSMLLSFSPSSTSMPHDYFNIYTHGLNIFIVILNCGTEMQNERERERDPSVKGLPNAFASNWNSYPQHRQTAHLNVRLMIH